jgi:ribonuclease G
MTRKRNRESINRLLSEDCFYCEGRGLLKTKTTICYEIFRSIEREAKEIPGQNLYLRVHPEISEMLLDEENQFIEFLERKVKKNIVIKAYEALHYEQYKISTY